MPVLAAALLKNNSTCSRKRGSRLVSDLGSILVESPIGAGDYMLEKDLNAKM